MRQEVGTMLEFLTMARWSPYIAGAGIGILSCLALVLADRPLGCSTAFVKARGLIGKVINAEKTRTMAYYQEIVPQVDWAFMIIPGIIIGAFLSSVLSGTFRIVWVPALWESVFGNNAVLRIIVALAGGILLGFGARWAGGCTSGHGISGSIQLSLASMITAACFFAGGIAVAMLLYRVIGVILL
ncbi:MAG: YeeE/YedE family protein [Methanoregula sp.]|nr:YeeE/YedE family protein [Methanoregula sp.]